jgi:phage terminase large subunit-like protein
VPVRTPTKRTNRKAKPVELDPTTAYAQAVVTGKIVAGKWIKKACARHLKDLENGHERGLHFDPKEAKVLFDFFGLLRHSKAKWAGEPFTLEPWQQFALGSLWGWRKADGARRFRIFHLEVARKNGKSTIAAGLALALLILDGEQGAEVYCCATKRDQARITFDEAKAMVAASPPLRKFVTPTKSNLAVIKTGSKLEPLAADADSLDGLNVHAGICDELHAWKQRLLWDVIETATGARSQPLLVVTTTAGHSRTSIWWELRDKAIKVLDGTFDDDQLLALIYTLDSEDKWDDEATWIKANPNLNVTIQLDELRKRCEEAKQTPGKQNPFRRLRLNMPTDQAELWLDMDLWDACSETIDEELLHGRECFSGLDLSQTLDLTALVHVFPPTEDDPKWRIIGRFWVPEARVQKRVERDRVPYDQWAEAGYILLTEGNVVEYATVKAKLLEDAGKFVIKELAFDRMFALPIIQEMQAEGIECVAFGQGFYSMTAPTKEFEKLLVSMQLAPPADPCWRWQAGNVAAKSDEAGNLKPDKSKSSDKIDGIVAAIMAIGRALAATIGEDSGGGVESW